MLNDIDYLTELLVEINGNIQKLDEDMDQLMEEPLSSPDHIESILKNKQARDGLQVVYSNVYSEIQDLRNA